MRERIFDEISAVHRRTGVGLGLVFQTGQVSIMGRTCCGLGLSLGWFEFRFKFEPLVEENSFSVANFLFYNTFKAKNDMMLEEMNFPKLKKNYTKLYCIDGKI